MKNPDTELKYLTQLAKLVSAKGYSPSQIKEILSPISATNDMKEKEKIAKRMIQSSEL